MSETELNKTEEPTPFKLRRARERGSIARGVDLGFFSALAGLAIFWVVAGEGAVRALAEAMRRVLTASIGVAASPQQAPAAFGLIYGPALQTVALLGATIVVVVAFFEIVQLRGLIFTTKPLKPDFGRLNPAKGLKRVFSIRMLKETAKSVAKMAAYAAAAFLVARYALDLHSQSIVDAPGLTAAMRSGGLRLLFAFMLIALAFAALDQIIARREFLKQMRMSRSELTREHKEREGEPRIKHKRKQLHAEFSKQTRDLGGLAGSDMLIVNPQHYAVGLRYDAGAMTAPQVTAKGRNRFALMLKRQAASLSIATFENAPLARALYKACERGDETPANTYGAVVGLYLQLPGARSRYGGANA